MTKKSSVLLAWTALLFICPSPVSGTPIVRVGDFVLKSNTAGQVIDIIVNGTENVFGLNFYIEIANEDGTPTSTSPVISNIDVNGIGTILCRANANGLGCKIATRLCIC